MTRLACSLGLGLLLCTAGAGFAAGAGIIYPHVDATMDTPEPVSLCCVPDGSGTPFTDAYNAFGRDVDATLSVTLYSDVPPWGDPIPNFPREDMWLAVDDGDLVLCPGGAIPDAATDPFGATVWTESLAAGGWADPDAGQIVHVYVNGAEAGGGALPALRINSPDLTQDLMVDIQDLAVFAEIFHGSYEYRADFRWDGDVNIADIPHLAEAMGAVCP